MERKSNSPVKAERRQHVGQKRHGEAISSLKPREESRI
jgi:hypothetical protein